MYGMYMYGALQYIFMNTCLYLITIIFRRKFKKKLKSQLQRNMPVLKFKHFGEVWCVVWLFCMYMYLQAVVCLQVSLLAKMLCCNDAGASKNACFALSCLATSKEGHTRLLKVSEKGMSLSWWLECSQYWSCFIVWRDATLIMARLVTIVCCLVSERALRRRVTHAVWPTQLRWRWNRLVCRNVRVVLSDVSATYMYCRCLPYEACITAI